MPSEQLAPSDATRPIPVLDLARPAAAEGGTRTPAPAATAIRNSPLAVARSARVTSGAIHSATSKTTAMPATVASRAPAASAAAMARPTIKASAQETVPHTTATAAIARSHSDVIIVVDVVLTDGRGGDRLQPDMSRRSRRPYSPMR